MKKQNNTLPNLIGISGKIGSGKDEIGKMINYLTTVDQPSFLEYKNRHIDNDRQLVKPEYKIVKFADKLKDITCLILGCTREQLEDSEFKEKELGEEWWTYNLRANNGEFFLTNQTKEQLNKWLQKEPDLNYTINKLTYRKLLQLIGTESGRKIIHENIWVNATFADYKATFSKIYKSAWFPNWILTDVRFLNEVKAIQDRGGILIRVERGPFYHYFKEEGCHKWSDKKDRTGSEWNYPEEGFTKKESFERAKKDLGSKHPSETALDDYEDWDYVIDNNGNLEDLLIKVKKIYESYT